MSEKSRAILKKKKHLLDSLLSRSVGALVTPLHPPPLRCATPKCYVSPVFTGSNRLSYNTTAWEHRRSREPRTDRHEGDGSQLPIPRVGIRSQQRAPRGASSLAARDCEATARVSCDGVSIATCTDRAQRDYATHFFSVRSILTASHPF